MKKSKSILRIWAFSFVVGFYTTFVVQSLWNWFAVPAFHLEPASYWLIYGLSVLFQAITEQYTLPDEQRWERAFIVLDACVQELRRDELTKQLDEQLETEWSQLWRNLIGKVLGNSLVLAIGWSVHTFLI